ncbi:phage baseplate protein [Leuconostoc mesenteroides]|uniref:phage baseplate protein n=1 Tax=Leuconostoc mesenteroides TaxID=1245 RepID=UPI002078662C|nr:hypothetical protein [Leuconostoc mesenteroides]USI45458.1 hypothetical protein M0D19_08155 [Leuconostoc mesenteroides]
MVKVNKLISTNSAGSRDQILPQTHAKSVLGFKKEVDRINQNVGIPQLNALAYQNKRFSGITNISAEFLLAPRVVRNAVMQSIMFDADLGQWFIGQTDISTPQGFTLTRTDSGGNMLSQMYFPKGGHGSSVFLIPQKNTTPLIFFQDEDVYRVTEYVDNSTVEVNKAQVSFKPPVNGNGMASYVDDVMVHINNQTDDLIMSVYKAQYDSKLKTFSFPDSEYASIDLKKMLADETNVLQGLTIMRKTEITGDTRDEGRYLILVEGGFPNVEFTWIPFEYIPDQNKLTKLKTVTQLDRIVKPSLSKNNIDWGDGYEPEGLFPIRINYAGSENSIVSGLAFGVSAGIGGKRKNYVMGFLNPIVSNLMSSARSAYHDTKTTTFIRDDVTSLFEIVTPGTYEIKRGDMQRMIDAPSNWRYVDSFSDWTLEVSVNNQQGDVIQTLTKRSLNAVVEKYIRIVDYSSAQLGADFAPRQVGYWNIERIDGQMAMITSATNNGMIKKMSDFNVPGTAFYLSVSKAKLIVDFEGADKFLEGRAFKIEVISWGGGADMYVQKIVFPKNDQFIVAYRLISAKRDNYGPGMIPTFTTLPKWTVFNGTLI